MMKISQKNTRSVFRKFGTDIQNHESEQRLTFEGQRLKFEFKSEIRSNLQERASWIETTTPISTTVTRRPNINASTSGGPKFLEVKVRRQDSGRQPYIKSLNRKRHLCAYL